VCRAQRARARARHCLAEPSRAEPIRVRKQSKKFFHQVLICYYNREIENTGKIKKDLKTKKQFESGKLDLIVYLLDPMA